MRFLIFHGYLLRGTGSNIYNASICRALVDLGHEVHILCQERQAAELDFVDAVGRFDGSELRLERRREPVRCTAYVPDIDGLLPVYVADRYEGLEAVPLPELDDRRLGRYMDANVAAVRAVAARVEPEAALANHLVMGPAILARALADRVPYAVKVHGSALEYVVRPHPKRFLPYAREGVAAAQAVLVGSRHTAESLWEVLEDPGLPARTRLGPPGVDVRAFRPREPAEAARNLRALAERLADEPAGWGGEPGAAAALRSLHPARDRLVGYVGKLIVSKGVDLLLAAWPLVVARVPCARLCVVGFGTYRDGLNRLLAALERRDLDALADLAARGRELEGGPRRGLRFFRAFLDSLVGARRDDYLAAGPEAASRVHFTGGLAHEHLPSVVPAFEAQVVPSTFPEAFGMVTVEAAACGVLPISAAHSGLAEVSRALAPELRPRPRRVVSFELGELAVDEIAERIVAALSLPAAERREAGAALAAASARRYAWESVAEGVLAAAQGRLNELPAPGGAGAAIGHASG